MISKYIKELIPENSRIIVPDFGAFMVQNTPNGKVISFNDFLKFNDSLLLNKIIVNEKMDATQGKEAIKAYVKEIETAFKAGEKFAVEGVGYLSKDAQNNIVFTQDENAKSQKTSAPKGATAKKDTAKSAPKVEEKKETATLINVEAKPAPSEVKPSEPEKKPVVSAPASGSSSKPTASNAYVKPQAPKNGKMEIKTKNKTLNIVIIVVAALLILGFLVWLAIDLNWFGCFKPAQQPKEEVVAVDTMPAIDSVAAADTVEAESLPEPTIISEPANPNAKHCYLIAGSFQVESNAVRFQQEMIDKGYQAEIVTRNNGFHYVSLKVFNTRVEAIAEWRNMTSEFPELWILIK